MNKLNQLLIIAAASVGTSFLLLTGVLMPAFAATSSTSTTQTSLTTTTATQAQAEDKNSGTLDGGVTWQIANDTLTISGGTISGHNENPGDPSVYPWRRRVDFSRAVISGPLNLVDNAGSYLFRGDSRLTTIDGLSNINTDQSTNLKGMFSDDKVLQSLDLSSFSTQRVTNMAEMFLDSPALTSVNLSSFDTRNVNNMGAMFNNATSLTSLDFSKLPNFKTNQVTEMVGMFSGDTSLSNLNVSTFDTGNVTNMAAMFANDPALTALNLANFNTKNVTSMKDMFSGDSGLASLNVSSFNTGNVTIMETMFAGNTALTSLDLSNFNTNNVTNMGGMFIADSALKWLNVSSFETPQVTNVSGMFAADSSLTSLNLANFDLSNVTLPDTMDSMLEQLTGLRRLTLGPKIKLSTRANLGAPGGKENWQAVATGTLTKPAGKVFSPADLMTHYAAVGIPLETYVPEDGIQDQSVIVVKPSNTLPIGAKFDPKEAFISAITPERRTVNSYAEAVAEGMAISGDDFNTNTAGQHTVTYRFSGSDKLAQTVVTITPNGGGTVTPTPTPSTPTAPTNPANPSSPSSSASSVKPTPPIAPTIPENTAKKKTVVYALKTIYLYKNPTFKKSQRLVKYPKQKRVNRPNVCRYRLRTFE